MNFGNPMIRRKQIGQDAVEMGRLLETVNISFFDVKVEEQTASSLGIGEECSAVGTRIAFFEKRRTPWKE